MAYQGAIRRDGCQRDSYDVRVASYLHRAWSDFGVVPAAELVEPVVDDGNLQAESPLQQTYEFCLSIFTVKAFGIAERALPSYRYSVRASIHNFNTRNDALCSHHVASPIPDSPGLLPCCGSLLLIRRLSVQFATPSRLKNQIVMIVDDLCNIGGVGLGSWKLFDTKSNKLQGGRETFAGFPHPFIKL